ncbi:MAG TPA: alpha/beta fold hydrolase [Gemmatimonadaceae bacterium]|nr:alpha/beta fold hydrolase [Gemmatimonadaceae bacterium]
MRILALGTAALCVLLGCGTRPGPTPSPAAGTRPPAPEARGLDEFDQQALFKALTDQSFYVQLAPEMIVRKVRYAGADKFVVPAYLFSPRDTTNRHATVIMVHGGVHGDLDDSYAWQIRSLVGQGYVVVAPEYRGSTGYGRAHYDAIDYGGKEVEDVINARDYLAAFVPWADTSRIGMLGWSHGGFITLHSIFRRPELFKVAVAHVPVADLVSRMQSHSAGYRRIFANQPGFGGPLETRRQAYVDRSPVSHVRELRTPLLVHAADNDQDVFIEENHHLRDSMIVAGKDKAGLYTYREWHDPPGGHAFSRLQTTQAMESWTESIAFLRRYLSPQSTPAIR